MIKVQQNLHTHTTYCDGKNTAEEMVQSAIDKGLTSIGFSGHAYTLHDTSYCMSINGTLFYAGEIDSLKSKYKGIIEIYTGLEQDYFSAPVYINTDYIIGSVHYVLRNDEYIPVDETKEIIMSAVQRLYGGDIYAFLEDYYNQEKDVYNKTKCDIVGHFDLCEKFNADSSLFDSTHPRYVNAWKNALETLVKQCVIFEINTGAMSRGYTNCPYPKADILKEILRLGGKICVSSDSHDVATVNYKLDEMTDFAAECGFREMWVLTDSGFKRTEIN